MIDNSPDKKNKADRAALNLHLFDDVEKCEVVDSSDDSEFQKYLQGNPSGLQVVPKNYRTCKGKLVSSDAGDFTKWLKRNHPVIPVSMNKGDGILDLRSSDIWMPLVFLASDVSVPIFLNLVSNYVYDRMKGALKNDKARVHLDVIYRDEKSGVTKEFRYEGFIEDLQKVIKKFDLNQFLDK